MGDFLSKIIHLWPTCLQKGSVRHSLMVLELSFQTLEHSCTDKTAKGYLGICFLLNVLSFWDFTKHQWVSKIIYNFWFWQLGLYQKTWNFSAISGLISISISKVDGLCSIWDVLIGTVDLPSSLRNLRTRYTMGNSNSQTLAAWA